MAEVVEELADQIEEVAEVTRRLAGRDWGFMGVGVGIGLVAGVAIGWYVAEKRLSTKYQKLAEDTIEEIRSNYQDWKKEKEEDKPEKPPLEEVVEELGYSEEESEEFVWDQDLEVSKRTKRFPYVIHLDEYKGNESKYDQIVYTYFEGDDVLSDVNDNVAVPEIVGAENLQRFGHGSGDKDIVYIRNDALTVEICIHRSPNSYAEVVHGFVEHSAKRKRRPPRRFDDD